MQQEGAQIIREKADDWGLRLQNVWLEGNKLFSMSARPSCNRHVYLMI